MKRIKIEWRRLNLFRRANETDERLALVNERIDVLRIRVRRLEEAMREEKKSLTAADTKKVKETEEGAQDGMADGAQDGNAGRQTDILRALRGGTKDGEREADANRVLNEFLLFPEELDRMKEIGHG